MIVDEYETFERKLDRYQRALSTLTALGIPIDGASRLRQYERAIAASIRDPRPAVEEETIFALGHALREADEIAEIVDGLPASPDSTTRDLLHALQGGKFDPDDESGAKAREAQYELYLGTLARRAGLLAVHGKPDLTITFEGVEYHREAKRPGGVARFDDRLRGAVSQLAQFSDRGIVAISIDQLIRPGHTLLRVPSFPNLAAAVAFLVRRFVAIKMPELRTRLAVPHVQALLLTARIPARVEDTGHLCVGTNIHLEKLGTPGDGTVEFATRLLELYMGAPSPSDA